MEPAIIVHGGAWAIPESLAERSRSGVKAAVVRGLAELQRGGSAVDAVEAAVRVMEDDSAFDAGTGSVLNAVGDVEMDAVIMSGSDLRVGAVAGVQNIRNPVSLARTVMDKTDHTMLVGPGANTFAAEQGFPTVSTDELVTPEARHELETFLKFKNTVDVSFKMRSELSHDTVGAVAIDKEGNLAFATSTGGITAKRPGRVGDCPLVGCGGYADNSAGGCSTTGHGEAITKVCLAHHVNNLLKQGIAPQQAAQQALTYMKTRVQGCGGVVVLDRHGNTGQYCTTQRMAWASARGSTLHYGLEPGEDITEHIAGENQIVNGLSTLST